jgi:signal transduction histidine kinase
MADRLEAVGGMLEVQSAPTAGTKILGRVPTATLEP